MKPTRSHNGLSVEAPDEGHRARLPPMRALPADGMASLRRIHQVLSRHDGISAELVQGQLVWCCLGTPIARVWVPDPHDARAAAFQFELTVFLPRHARSPRWSDVVPLQPDRLAHHLPVRCRDDVDLQVLQWLQEAWDSAWHRLGAPVRRQDGGAAQVLRCLNRRAGVAAEH